MAGMGLMMVCVSGRVWAGVNAGAGWGGRVGGRLGGEGVRSIDDAVARRVDRDGDGEFSGTKADNFFYLTDVMFSVRAIVDGEGRLHTRLDYTPYGVAMHGFAADVNGDGVVNSFDLTAFNAVYNAGTALRPGATGYDPDADLSGSGSMNFFDYTAFVARLSAYSSGGSNPTFKAGWIDNPSDANGPDNSIGYDGYVFALAGATEATSTGLYRVRNRVYDPRLGRWLQGDPLEYVDGMNRFAISGSSPSMISDPLGLCGSLALNPAGLLSCTHSLLMAAGYSQSQIAAILVNMGWTKAALAAAGGAALGISIDSYLKNYAQRGLGLVGELGTAAAAAQLAQETLASATEEYRKLIEELGCNAGKGLVDKVCKGENGERKSFMRGCRQFIENGRVKLNDCDKARDRAIAAAACAAARAAYKRACPGRAGANMDGYEKEIDNEKGFSDECFRVYLECLLSKCQEE